MDLLQFREWLAEEKRSRGTTISLPDGDKRARKQELKDKILKAKSDKELAAAVDEILAMGLRLKPKNKRADVKRWLMERKLECLKLLEEF